MEDFCELLVAWLGLWLGVLFYRGGREQQQASKSSGERAERRVVGSRHEEHVKITGRRTAPCASGRPDLADSPWTPRAMGRARGRFAGSGIGGRRRGDHVGTDVQAGHTLISGSCSAGSVDVGPCGRNQ